MSTLDADSGEVVPDGTTQPFPNPGEVSVDHVGEATGQIAIQYAKAARLIATVTAFAAAAQRIEDCAVSIPPLDDPAIATGNAGDPVGSPGPLDVTGDLIGQTRVLSNGTVVNDATYRVYIAMRILRNASIASSPELIAALTSIFGATPFRYYSLGGMVVGIEVAIGSPPSSDTIALLNDGPVPYAMGVGVGREWYGPTTWFGFDEDPRSGVRGFGEIGNPSVGGHLAELF